MSVAPDHALSSTASDVWAIRHSPVVAAATGGVDRRMSLHRTTTLDDSLVVGVDGVASC